MFQVRTFPQDLLSFATCSSNLARCVCTCSSCSLSRLSHPWGSPRKFVLRSFKWARAPCFPFDSGSCTYVWATHRSCDDLHRAVEIPSHLPMHLSNFQPGCARHLLQLEPLHKSAYSPTSVAAFSLVCCFFLLCCLMLLCCFQCGCDLRESVEGRQDLEIINPPPRESEQPREPG